MAEDPGPWGRAQAEARARAESQPQPAQAEPQGLPIGLFIWLGLLAAAGLGFFAMAYLMPNRLGSSGWGDALADFGMLALVSAGLVRLRGIDAGRVARNATIWVAIVGVLALGYAYRGELQDVGQRLQTEVFPDTAAAAAPRALVIMADADGQFAVNGVVNGHRVRFVVDTGSSDIVLSPQDAQAVGVDISSLNFHRMFATANGGGAGADYVAPTLEIGAIRLSNVHASINRAPMGESLLGMSFLRRMDSVEIKGDRMTLRWKG
ncbi:retropepsin-like aspartic protease family protein [Caulobacter sp. KR2-114]|uniref:retropepsin-like aspartic protease family protein n=1 Tax=Caulobacter sp. KR2-114 TaxID=3400912 RepID=UPI003C03F193